MKGCRFRIYAAIHKTISLKRFLFNQSPDSAFHAKLLWKMILVSLRHAPV